MSNQRTKWTEQQFADWQARHGKPVVIISHANIHPDGQTPCAELERAARHGPLATGETQGGDSSRFLVRVTSFRRRLLDEDNIAEKYAVDCCRYAGLLPADDPRTTKIEVAQIKVKFKAEERTEILIEFP